MFLYKVLLIVVFMAVSFGAPQEEEAESIYAPSGDVSLPLTREDDVSKREEKNVNRILMDDEDKPFYLMDGEASVPNLRDGEASVPNLQDNLNAPENLGAAAIQQFLDIHNKLRKQEGAANIVKLVWNNQLAEMAQKWADKCSFAHGQPSSPVSPFQYTGQNIYAKTPYPTGEIDYNDITMKWFNEKNDYDFESTKCTKVCGHYTQVVWHDTTDLGCGVKQCPTLTGTSWTNALIVVCNYGPTGNWRGQKPYAKGGKCALCPDSCEDGLCKKAK